MKKPIHCGKPARPYFKQFFREDKSPHSSISGFRCRECGARLLEEGVAQAITEHWIRTEPEREKLRVEGIATDAGYRDLCVADVDSHYGYWKKGDLLGRPPNSPAWERVVTE